MHTPSLLIPYILCAKKVPITYLHLPAMFCSPMQCTQQTDYAILYISCSLWMRLRCLFENKKCLVPLKAMWYFALRVRTRDENRESFLHLQSCTVFWPVQAWWLAAAAQSAAVQSICLINVSLSAMTDGLSFIGTVFFCIYSDLLGRKNSINLARCFVWTRNRNKQILKMCVCVFSPLSS